MKSLNLIIMDILKKLGINNPTQEQMMLMQTILNDAESYHVKSSLDEKVMEHANAYKLKSKTGWLTLTKREIECLNYLSRGKNRKEIANLIGISTRTVDTHLEKARNKLGCFTNSELISLWWKRQGE